MFENIFLSYSYFQFESSHTQAVNSFIWFGKTGFECFTGSADGTVKWWDIRVPGIPTGIRICKEVLSN